MFLSTTSDKVSRKEIRHSNIVREAAPECMVLMEHDGTLPLPVGASIALYGSGARKTIKGGTGSGDVNSRHVVSIDEGLRNAGFAITTDSWLDEYDRIFDKNKKAYDEWVEKEVAEKNKDHFSLKAENPFRYPAGPDITDAELNASKADAAIYVISRSCGEGADRKEEEGDYLPTREELADLKALASFYGNVVLVLNIGAVMELKRIKEIRGIGTVLLLGQVGCTIGDSFADVVSGKSYPSGKLADTWAINYQDYPSSYGFSHNNGNLDDEYYEDGIFVGYRYFDTFGVKPLYGFGYGLSYTSFKMKMINASSDVTDITIRVKVTNTGKYPGREVVQCYLSKPSDKLVQPFRELCAYIKTPEIQPGMSDVVDIRFDLKDMASFDVDARANVLEKGQYIVYIGGSLEASVPELGITLDKTVITRKSPTAFPQDAKVKEIRPSSVPKRDMPDTQIFLSAPDVLTDRLPSARLSVNTGRPLPKKITVIDILKGVCEAEDFVDQLSVEEMATLCVGIMRKDANNGGEVVGDCSRLVPGAAGETSSICAKERGLRPLVLADGPAGLRLEQSYEYEGQTHYQYTTAIPVGWSIAQSWNMDLAKDMGDLVGVEMSLFHIDLWLAPALNIHRNPLCGRNFEYYSEDPVISGTMAAAVTNGVQHHAGVGTTIKHFACNNLEDNRFFNNSHLSERTMRDIYLKGFEIAVKRSSPRALMSSYNLINGTHAANCKELLTGVLRDEWGYRGLVMTDWFTSVEIQLDKSKPAPIYPISSSAGCIYAGNDLQMPGCQKNFDDIVKAVKDGEEVDGYKISLDDLKRCALHVVEAVVYAARAD